MGEQQDPHVLFRFRSPAPQVYLMTLSDDGAGWSLNQMAPSNGDHCLWELLLPLPPGRHRVRYYVYDGRCTVYSEPTDEAGATVDGLDLIIDVPNGSVQGLYLPPPTQKAIGAPSHTGAATQLRTNSRSNVC